MGVCDVCNKNLANREGYILTTLEVVSTPGYWQKILTGPMSTMMVSLGGSTDSFKAQIASQAASQTTPWMICNDCIGFFAVDKQRARQYALRWYESGGTFAHPGCGAVPLSKINMGDGKVYLRGGSPEAMELDNRLSAAKASQKQSSCFIATAAFTVSSYEVSVLRQFRDQILEQMPGGKKLVAVYYKVSPPLAKWIARSDWRKRIIRCLLRPFVRIARRAMRNK